MKIMNFKLPNWQKPAQISHFVNQDRGHRRNFYTGLRLLCIQKETEAKERKERADFDILMYGKPYIVLWEI